MYCVRERKEQRAENERKRERGRQRSRKRKNIEFQEGKFELLGEQVFTWLEFADQGNEGIKQNNLQYSHMWSEQETGE